MTQTIIIIESGTDFTRFIQAEYIFQNRIILHKYIDEGENGFQRIEGIAFCIDVSYSVSKYVGFTTVPFSFIWVTKEDEKLLIILS